MAIHEYDEDYSLAQPTQDKIQQLLNELDEPFVHRSPLWDQITNPKNRSPEIVHVRQIYVTAAFYMCSRDLAMTAKKTGIKKILVSNIVREVRSTQPEVVNFIEKAIGEEMARYMKNDLIVPTERITASGARGMVEKFDVLANTAYTELLKMIDAQKVSPAVLVSIIKLSVEEIRELVKMAQSMSKTDDPTMQSDDDIAARVEANKEMLRSAQDAVKETDAGDNGSSPDPVTDGGIAAGTTETEVPLRS